MSHYNQLKHPFYVVQFLELPFEGVDDYVCVPVDWLVAYRERDQKASVAYPTDEDPFDTRDRARRSERYGDEWRCYMANVKYESDNYSEAEFWIATRNDYGPLAEEELNINTQRRSTLNRALPSADRNRAAATNNNPREPQATNNNPREPQATNNSPREPQATNNNPREPQATNNSPREPQATNDNSREPQATNNSPREPQATNDNSREPQATNDNSREPQATNDNSREPQATNDNPREPQTTNDEPRKPTPGLATKRPAPPNANKRHDKRSKPSETAQSSACSEPGCSREQAIIIHDDEPIASAQARVIASNGDSRSSQSIDGNPQQLSMPAIDVDMPTSVTQNKNRRTSITNQIQETSDDNSNKSISHNLLNSLKISAHLYRDMNRARRLVPIGPPVEKILSFLNTERTKAVPSAVAAQNPSSLLDRAGSLSTPSMEEQSSVTQTGSHESQDGGQSSMHTESGIATSFEENQQEAKINVVAQNVPSSNQDSSSVRRVHGQQGSLIREQHTRSRQDQCLQIGQNSFERDPLRGSTERKEYDHRPNSRTITTRLRTRQNPANPLTPSYQTRETQQQRQSQPNQPPLQPQRPKININIYIKPKKERMSTVGRILDSLRRALREGHVVHEQVSETSPTERALVGNHSNAHQEACQTDDSKAAELSGPNAHADHRTASGSSTDDQTHSRHVPDQRMLENSATHNQMPSTSRATCDVSYNLQSSILETPETYTNLLDTVERFNTLADVSLEIPVTERHEVSTTQQKKKHNNFWRFVLPPEYDRDDTRWTLKYRENLPGLVRMTPGSRVYVSCGDLKYCLQVSKDCKSLARRLLSEVFNRNALSVCLTMAERAQASDNVDVNARPELDAHASSVLLNFVLEYGLQRGWNTDLLPILNTIDSKMKEIRFKYGVRVQAN